MEVTQADYTFVERGDTESWVVRILRDPYRDTYVTYGKVQIVEKPEQDPVLKFSYQIVESDIEKRDLERDKTFMNLLGDILSQIIVDATESGKYRVGDKE